NTKGPSTTASGPITTRRRRRGTAWNQLLERSTVTPPRTCEPTPTVMSPLTVRTWPATRVSTSPMAPLTVSTSPPIWLPRSTNTPPLTVATPPVTWASRSTLIEPLTVSRLRAWAPWPRAMLPFTVLAAPTCAVSSMWMAPLTVSRSPYGLPALASMLPLTLLTSSAAHAGAARARHSMNTDKRTEWDMGYLQANAGKPVSEHGWLQSASV